MRNFSIQTLALMMMIMLVYTATLSHKKREMTITCPNNTSKTIMELKKIHDDAKTLLKKRDWNETVFSASGPNHECPKLFFCHAEQSLHGLGNESHAFKAAEILIRELHQYNNKTVCHQNQNIKYTAKHLLTNITGCATNRIKYLEETCHHLKKNKSC